MCNRQKLLLPHLLAGTWDLPPLGENLACQIYFSLSILSFSSDPHHALVAALCVTVLKVQRYMTIL